MKADRDLQDNLDKADNSFDFQIMGVITILIFE